MTTKPTMKEWREQNHLEPNLVESVLRSIATISRTAEPSPVTSLKLSFERAKMLAIEAISEALGLSPEAVSNLLADVTFERHEDQTRRPVTRLDANTGAMKITLFFDCRCNSILDLAHEIGHVVQIKRASKFIPSVAREVAALMTEVLVAEKLTRKNPDHRQEVEREIQRRAIRNLLVHGEALSAAAGNDDAVYSYEWNYPIAQFIVDGFDNTPADIDVVTDVFDANIQIIQSIRHSIKRLTGTFRQSLPAISNEELPEQAQNYRTIGICWVLGSLSNALDRNPSIGDFLEQFNASRDALSVEVNENRQPIAIRNIGQDSSAMCVVPLTCRSIDPVSNTTNKDQYYIAIGQALSLYALSEYHRRQSAFGYIEREFLPAMSADKCIVYCNEGGGAIGLVTWADLSAAAKKEVEATGRGLRENEWSCGDQLYFNDFVSPWGFTRRITQDLIKNRFPNRKAFALRRTLTGGVRRQCALSSNQRQTGKMTA